MTKHAYDENGNAWADLTAGGSLTTRRLYADAVDALMARIGSSNDEDWYLTDLLGSVRDIADSTGAGINHLDYHTFGGVATETSPTDGDRYAWTGRERDVETGLQYNRARWYDPATKRWLSQDPMGFDAGDSNLYRYATNSSASSTDANGMWPEQPDLSELASSFAKSGKKIQVDQNQGISTLDYDNYAAAKKAKFAAAVAQEKAEWNKMMQSPIPPLSQMKASAAEVGWTQQSKQDTRAVASVIGWIPLPGCAQMSMLMMLGAGFEEGDGGQPTIALVIGPGGMPKLSPQFFKDLVRSISAGESGGGNTLSNSASARGVVPSFQEASLLRENARNSFQMPRLSLRERISGVNQSAVDQRIPGRIPGEVPLGSPALAPHTAVVAIADSAGNIRLVRQLTSAESSAASFERMLPGWRGRAMHTEARATTRLTLQRGETMVILGELSPCSSCRGFMNRAAATTGGNIQYQWWENGRLRTWSANAGRGGG